MVGKLFGCCLLLAAVVPGTAADEAGSRARLEVRHEEATVGDRLAATLTLDLEEGEGFEPAALGSEIGPFSVEGGAWSAPSEDRPAGRWIWSGELVAFRTGVLRIPPIELRVVGQEGPYSVSTEPLEVTVLSVLGEEDLEQEEPALADLKGPASIAPRLGPLWVALGGLLLLLALAALLWWLHRRYAGRWAAVHAPDDPFRRTPPHVWIYAELERLLARRLAEEGRIDLFYAELSRILKIYLGGRFRVDLLEHTTAELPGRLRPARMGDAALDEVIALLDECDRVKFARHRPGPECCRGAVERIYRIVDTTKPAQEQAAPPRQGAA